jgi:hypothetical protein
VARAIQTASEVTLQLILSSKCQASQNDPPDARAGSFCPSEEHDNPAAMPEVGNSGWELFRSYLDNPAIIQ